MVSVLPQRLITGFAEVVVQALSQAAQVGSENDRAIMLSTVALFLFGVPNSGLNHQNLLSMVQHQRNAPLVRELMEDSVFLRVMNQNFEAYCRLEGCSIVSFYETRETATVMVSSNSDSWRAHMSSLLYHMILNDYKGGSGWEIST
jgi:hypothetical protein